MLLLGLAGTAQISRLFSFFFVCVLTRFVTRGRWQRTACTAPARVPVRQEAMPRLGSRETHGLLGNFQKNIF